MVRPALPSQFVGTAGYVFSKDLYNKFHVAPTKIDVGNLTGVIVREVELWNAYLVSKVCQAVGKGGMDGIDVDVEETGFTIGALQSRTFTLTIQMDGPPVIDAHLTMDFGSEVLITVVIIGRRIVAWVWPVQAPMRETLEWFSDVIASRSGKEQRARLRNSPRQAFTINAFARFADEATSIETAIYGWQARSWALPLWAEKIRVTTALPVGTTGVDVDTRFSDFRPTGLVMLWQSPEVNETLQLSDVTSSRLAFVLPTTVAFTGPVYALPVRTVRMLGNAKRYDYLADASRFECNFLVIDNVEFAGDPSPVQYKELDVLLDRIIVEGDFLVREIDRPMNVIDYHVGTATIDVPRAYSTSTYEMRWQVDSPEEAWAMRKWFHRRAGRVVPFWAPTWRTDLSLVDTVGAAEKSFRIRDVSFSRLLYGTPVRKHLFVELVDGSQHFFEILGAVTGAPGEDIITIDGFFGQVVPPENVRRMSWLSLFRLDADTVEFSWDEVGHFTVAVPIKEIER